MAQPGWHILREDHAVTVARHLPPRFDVAVAARIGTARRVSLTAVAQQVRQDAWRALARVPGYSPVVRVTREDGALLVEAGGRLADPRRAGGAEDRLGAVLADADNRARWLSHAGRHA